VNLQGVLSTLVAASVELALVLSAAIIVYAIVGRALGRVEGRSSALADSSRQVKSRVRNALIVTCVLLAAAILAYNGWLVAHGIDAWTQTLGLLAAIGSDIWIRVAIALAELIAAALAFLIAVRLVRRGLGRVERAVVGWDGLRDHDESVTAAFVGLTRAIVTAGWLLLAVLAVRLFAVPATIAGGLVTIVRAYLVVAIGLLLIWSSVLIVDIVDGMASATCKAATGSGITITYGRSSRRSVPAWSTRSGLP
jgi:hypothetical protein